MATAIMQSDELRHVTISVEEYKSLVEKAQKLDLMADALEDASILDYSGKKLNIYGDSFDMIIKMLDVVRSVLAAATMLTRQGSTSCKR